MLEPGRTAPVVVGGTPIRRYLCGDYVAVLNTDIRSVGPITYLHLLIIFHRSDLSSPVMFVTAERNSLSALTLSLLPDDLRKTAGSDFGKSIFLGVFDQSGRRNLGIANDCSDIDVFAERALDVMKGQLKLAAPVEALDGPMHSSGSKTRARHFNTLLWALAFTAAVIGIAAWWAIEYSSVASLRSAGNETTLSYVSDTGERSGRRRDIHIYTASIDGTLVRLAPPIELGAAGAYQIIYDSTQLDAYSIQSQRAFRGYIFGQKAEPTGTLLARKLGKDLQYSAAVWVVMLVGMVISWRAYLRGE